MPASETPNGHPQDGRWGNARMAEGAASAASEFPIHSRHLPRRSFRGGRTTAPMASGRFPMNVLGGAVRPQSRPSRRYRPLWSGGHLDTPWTIDAALPPRFAGRASETLMLCGFPFRLFRVLDGEQSAPPCGYLRDTDGHPRMPEGAASVARTDPAPQGSIVGSPLLHMSRRSGGAVVVGAFVRSVP
jgi:hypothetical protein